MSAFHRLPAGSAPINDARDLGTVLGIWAHPDDEAFLSGGLMAAAATRATGGLRDRDPRRARHQRPRSVASGPPGRGPRTRVRASLAALGVNEHHLLGIADGPCAAQPQEAIVRRLAVIDSSAGHDRHVRPGRDHRPRGPPDRLAVGDRRPRAAAPEPDCCTRRPPRSSCDVGTLARGVDVFLADGLPLRRPRPTGPRCADPHALDRKMVALRAQATQTTALFAALGEDRVRRWWSTETFVAADAIASSGQWGTWRVAA